MNDMTPHRGTTADVRTVAHRVAPMKVFTNEKIALKAGQWVAAIAGNDKAAQLCRDNGIELKVQSEGTNSAGGFLVPIELVPFLINRREAYGAYRQGAQVVPMGTDNVNIPVLTSGLTTYWTAENVALTESSMAFGSVGLSAKKLIGLMVASSELVEDAAIDLAEIVFNDLAAAFAKAEDEAGFNGDGTSAYANTVGICPQLLDGTHNAGKVTAAAGHDTFAEIDAVDIGGLMAKLPSFAWPGARWYVSAAAFGLCFARLASSFGGFVSRQVGERNELLFAGFPVSISPALPNVATDLSGQVMLLFGDLSLAAVLGDRRQLAVTTSSHRYLETDRVIFKGRERVDIVNHNLGNNTSPGSIVGLVGE